jgi:MoaA/NifB/PqqE/SkfB family radical SAM enzyme
MTWRTLRRTVDVLLASKRHELDLWFTGGEPLLAWPLIRRGVAYVGRTRRQSQHVRFGLSTNGLLLDDAVARHLVAHDFVAQLSFDGLPPAQDARAAGSFRTLDARLVELRRRAPDWFAARFEVAVTVTGANARFLAESVRYFLDRGVGCVSVSPRVTADADWSERTFEILRTQLDEVAEACLGVYRSTGRVPVPRLRPRAKGNPSQARPPSEWLCALAEGTSLCVDVDGQVAGCGMLVESYQALPPGLLPERVASLRLGSIHDPGLAERFAGLPAALAPTRLFEGRSRKHSSLGRCEDCSHRPECSICPICIGYVAGNTDPDRMPDVPCGFNRILGDCRARFRARLEEERLARERTTRERPLPA